jgi:hypothetical protein
MAEKAAITQRFLQRKMAEYEALHPEFVTFAPFLSKFGHPLAE